MDSISEYKVKTSTTPEIIAETGFWERLRNAGAWAIANLGFDLIILLSMSVLLAFLVRQVGSHIRWLHPSLGLPIAIMSAVLLVDFSKWIYFLMVHKSNRARQFIRQIPVIFRDWAPFLLIDFIYENLHDLSETLSSFDIAPLLYQLDLAIFGFEPTLWSQKITTPWMTDFMAILYAPYLAYPLILMGILSLTNRRKEFKQISMAIILTFLMGFICYVVFPCLPPRFYLEGLFTDPVSLNGTYIHDNLQGVWDKLSTVRGAAFPSLHVAISSIALFFAYRFRNLSKLFRVIYFAYIPLILGLWSATIYLRHHWVGDIFAGLAVSSLAIVLAKKLLFLQSQTRSNLGWAEN